MTSVEKASVVETPQSPGKIALKLEVLIIKNLPNFFPSSEPPNHHFISKVPKRCFTPFP